MNFCDLVRPVLLLAALGAGCAPSPTQSAPPDLRTSEAADCVSFPERCGGCRADEHCATDPDLPRCDVVKRVCVACLPDNDNCPAGQVCQGTSGTWSCVSTCTTNSDCQKVGGGSSCCGRICVNLAGDILHCGACGAVCPTVANGAPACVEGRCVVGACNAGFDDCDHQPVNGCEAIISDDPLNCSACGKQCMPFSNGLPVCTAGRCSAICAPNFGDCNNNVADGCEADVTFDIRHCGACGRACSAPANAVPYCDLGKCSFRCKLAFGDCDGNPGNGCEVNLNGDTASCGHCGNVCPIRPGAKESACLAGVCGSNCNPGMGDCDNKPANGCEARFENDLAHCGGCGKACRNNNAVATCEKGVCTLQCKPNFVDCNNDPSDGCEANLLADGKHCGGCGMVCPQNTPYCKGGQCIENNCGNMMPLIIGNVVLCYTNMAGTCQMAHQACEALGGGYRLMCGDDWQPGRTGEGCGGAGAYTAYDIVNQHFKGSAAIGGYSQNAYDCVGGGANNACNGDSGYSPASNINGFYAFCSPKNYFKAAQDGPAFGQVCGN